MPYILGENVDISEKFRLASLFALKYEGTQKVVELKSYL